MPQTSSVFFVGNQNGCTRPPSCYPRHQFYLKWTLISGFCGIPFFQLNSDFISNSNLNPSELLPHPYISLGALPPRLPIPISPQNQTIAATWVPPTSPVPLITATPVPKPSKLNHVLIVRSQGDKTWIPDLPKGSDNYRFGWIRDTPIRLKIQRNEPCNLSTTNPLVISRAAARLTSPRRLTLACESKNTSKCTEKQPNHRK
jgi:hypothetical protein